jgi:hypothetical protein
MADAASIAGRHNEALREVAEILERHDPNVGARIAKARNGDGISSPNKRPLETAALHAEALRSLARIVDERLTPRKRGRPRKAS